MSAWYEQSFGEDYLIVYKHRDLQGAYTEVKRMVGWLGLEQDAEILDLCCGTGRHSLALNDSGYRVTGVDLSGILLTEAQSLDMHNKVKWVKGDMRSVPLGRMFDAVVNLFTSFGYFDRDEENAQVFSEIYRLLKPHGKFIIDYLNPSYVITHLVTYSNRKEGKFEIEEQRKIEDGFVRKTITIKEAGMPERVYREQVKLYALEQFQAMLKTTGLQLDRIYGNYDEASYNKETSPRLIMMGHKKGK